MLLLLIDEDKVREQSERVTVSYVVSPHNVEGPEMAYEVPTTHLASLAMTLPPDVEKARERLLALRQRLIDAGNRPLSPEELEEVIAETRGRS